MYPTYPMPQVVRRTASERWRATWRPIAARPAQRVGRVGTAVAIAIGFFAIGFVPGIYNAIALNAGWVTSGSGLSAAEAVSSALTSIATAAGLLVGLIAVLSRVGVSPRALGLARPRGERDWFVDCVGAAVFIASMMTASILMNVWGTPGYPDSGGYDWLAVGVGGILAGPTEELVVVATVVVMARRIRLTWPVILIIGIALRLSYHIYYGPAVAAMAIWALATLLYYMQSGRVLGPMIAHSLWNTIAVAAMIPGADTVGVIGTLLLIGYLLGIAIWAIVRVAMRTGDRYIAAPPRSSPSYPGSDDGWYHHIRAGQY